MATIKSYFKNGGKWNINCNTSIPYVYMNVVVVFESPTSDLDGTEFSIKAYDIDELSELFAEFCKENGFPTNTVVNIIVSHVARTMEELE